MPSPKRDVSLPYVASRPLRKMEWKFSNGLPWKPDASVDRRRRAKRTQHGLMLFLEPLKGSGAWVLGVVVEPEDERGVGRVVLLGREALHLALVLEEGSETWTAKGVLDRGECAGAGSRQTRQCRRPRKGGEGAEAEGSPPARAQRSSAARRAAPWRRTPVRKVRRREEQKLVNVPQSQNPSRRRA